MSDANKLHIYNSLSGEKELLQPIIPGYVGMYVCGPTLYSEPHMGNLRTFINFDLVYRYLLFLGLKVRYVRNITDAGHITNSAGEAVDSIGRAAKAEQLQSAEIVYRYNVKFQSLQRLYNMLPPSIEPTATQHIQEQIEVIEEIINNGFAYEVNGSVYFDVRAYSEKFHYGILSGRKVDELEEETRSLNAQDDKRFFADFALWKKANPDDMQVWRSPWGDGNPGRHIECTAMSTKYLGKKFDIHGGGMDLKFPHHEDEIAQSCGSHGENPANTWMHANMLNVNGQKMSKSLGNYFLPGDIVAGTTGIFSRKFSASVVRFLMLQSHYRSTMDMTEKSLEDAEKNYERIGEALKTVKKLPASATSSYNVSEWTSSCYDAMNDDFNSPLLVAQLFEAVKVINSVAAGSVTLTADDISLIGKTLNGFVYEVLGLEFDQSENSGDAADKIMSVLLEMRKEARENKDWPASDKIRDKLASAGIVVKDGKDGTTWSVN